MYFITTIKKEEIDSEEELISEWGKTSRQSIWAVPSEELVWMFIEGKEREVKEKQDDMNQGNKILWGTTGDSV